VAAVDGLLQQQAIDDGDYFAQLCTGRLEVEQLAQVKAGVLRAYRWQYILSGAQNPRFVEILTSLITADQGLRIQRALAPLQ